MSEATASTVTTTTPLDRTLASDQPVLLKTKALESRVLQSRVPYSIYVHHLNPLPSFGETGDVFYALQTRSIFWKSRSDWVEWEGIYKSERSRERNAQHPLHPKFLLFLSENTHATWQTEDGFRTSCNRLLKRLGSELDIKPTVPFIVQSASFFVDQLWDRRSRYPEVFGGQEIVHRPTKRQRTDSQAFVTAPILDPLPFHPSTEPSKPIGYVDFYRGTRFPFDCPTITWRDNRKVVLPYTTSSDGQNIDALTVQAMLSYPDGLATPQAPFKVITLPPNLSSQFGLRTQLLQDIRHALANHELVLVKGWYCEDPISLANKDSILYHARNPRSHFKCKDTRARVDAFLRGEEPEPMSIDIGSFITNVENPVVCQQISDFTVYPTQVPFFVRDLSDGDSALRATEHLVESWSTSSRKAQGSTTLSHAGFLSYPKETLSASCTYTHVMEGRKAVSVYLPTSEGQHGLSSPQIHDLLSAPMSHAHHTVPAYTIWLEPGDTLLQPPLVYRTEYSAEESICTQGSFELFDTLQFKLQYFTIRSFLNGGLAESSTDEFSTFLGTLCRMVMSMPYQAPSRTVPLAAMYALAAFTIKSDEFHPIVSKAIDAVVPELQVARASMVNWLQHVGIQESVDVLQTLVLDQAVELATKQIHLYSPL